MIELKCDMCKNKCDRLYHIDTNILYNQRENFGVDIDEMFRDRKKDCITKKEICENCKNIILKNALAWFKKTQKK